MLDDLRVPDGQLYHCLSCTRIAWADGDNCPLCGHHAMLGLPPTPTNGATDLDILQRYQAYRRGHDPRNFTDTGLTSGRVGEAIDNGIEALRTLAKINEAMEPLCHAE